MTLEIFILTVEDIAMIHRHHVDQPDVEAKQAETRSTTQTAHTLPQACWSESVGQVRQRVLRAVNQGDFNKAISMLSRLITSDPVNAEDYNNRGLVYLWSGQPHKALMDLNRAIALNPNLPSAYNNRANCYATQGALSKALADYDRAIDLNPYHVRARINQAITLRELGRYDEALTGFDDALLFRQYEGDIYLERGRTYHLRGDWNSAIADYQRALALVPDFSNHNSCLLHPKRQKLLNWLHQLNSAA